jgi:hypothetical protein
MLLLTRNLTAPPLNASASASRTRTVTAGAVTQHPRIVQQASGTSTTFTSTANTVTLPATASVGNLIVFALAGDKNTGTVTMTGTGWTVVHSLPSTSVSLYVAWKVSDGTETTITATTSAAPLTGNTCWAAEVAQSGTGPWGTRAQASNITDEVGAVSWATGQDTATADGLAFAAIAVDTAANVPAGSWSDGYANVYDAPSTSGSGGGAGGIHVGAAPILSGGVAGSIWATSGGVADQISGAVVVVGRGSTAGAAALSRTRSVTGAAVRSGSGSAALSRARTLTAAGAAVASASAALTRARAITTAAARSDAGQAPLTRTRAITADAAKAAPFRAAVAGQANATTVTLTIPAAVEAGDGLIASLSYANTAALTSPAGWTVLATATQGTLTSVLYSRAAGASDAGTTVTWTVSVASRVVAAIVAYQGTDTASPVSGFASAVSTAAVVSPPLTTTTDGCAEVQIVTQRGAATGAWTPPGGLTERIDEVNAGGGGLSLAVADATTGVPTGSALGSDTWTPAVPSTAYVAWTVALQPPQASVAADATLTRTRTVTGAAVRSGLGAAALTRTREVTGEASRSQSATAALARARAVTASAAGAGPASVGVTRLRAITTAASRSQAASADLTRTRAVTGTAGRGGTGAAALTRTREVTASAARSSTGAAALTRARAVTGSAARADSGAAALTRARAVAAAAARDGNGAAALTRVRTVTATTARTDPAAASLNRTRAVTGTAARGGAGAAALTRARAFTAAGSLSNAGQATLTRTRQVTGAATQTFPSASTGAALTRARAVTATAARGDAVAAALARARQLTTAAARSGAGASALTRARQLTTAAARSGAGQAAVTRTRALNAAAAVTAAPTAALLRARTLNAAGTKADTASALMTRTRAVSASLAADPARTGSVTRLHTTTARNRLQGHQRTMQVTASPRTRITTLRNKP